MKMYQRWRFRLCRMRATHVLLLLTVLAVGLWVSAPLILVKAIRNDQIHWDGNIAGLVPSSRSIWPRLILLRVDACVPGLVVSLNDDSRFVAAHVCLKWMLTESRI